MTVTTKKLAAVALGLVVGIGGPALVHMRVAHHGPIQRVVAVGPGPGYDIQPLFMLPPFWIVLGREAPKAMMSEDDAMSGVAVAALSPDGLALREGRGRFAHLRPTPLTGRIRSAATGGVDEPPVPLTARPVETLASARGVVPADVFERTINQHRSEIRSCAGNRGDPRQVRRPQGKLALRWIIRLDGGARDVRVSESTVDDPRLIRCVVASVGRWRFSRPGGGPAPVSSSFVFQ